MSVPDFSLFTAPQTYVSGMTALSIPDPGKAGGDWHFVEALCLPSSKIQSAGAAGSLVDTNFIFGSTLIEDKITILREFGANPGTVNSVYCATHPRAIADLLYRSVSRGVYPGHVEVDGMLEVAEEFTSLEHLLDTLKKHLSVEKGEMLERWICEFLQPARDELRT